MKQLFTNNAVTLLAAPITASSTSFTVMSGYGQLFPNPGPNEYFLVTLQDQSGSFYEIIRVTSRSGDVFNFALSDRAQENTIARAWAASLGNDTLVDHRVTAETLERAMQLPTVEFDVQLNGVTVGSPADTLNFTGSVSVVGTGSTKTITIASGGSGNINGESTVVPVLIEQGWTRTISSVIYSQYQRGFKFLVTIVMPSNGQSSTFEVLGNITGNLGSNSEIVSWTKTNYIGYKFNGALNILLNTTTKELDLTWNNSEINPVEILCTRIQHLP